jgi:predicted XRE-type DNA-binding protein
MKTKWKLANEVLDLKKQQGIANTTIASTLGIAEPVRELIKKSLKISNELELIYQNAMAPENERVLPFDRQQNKKI